MENKNFDIEKYLIEGTSSLKEFILLIRTNLRPFILITLLIISAFVAYAFFAKNIYKSSVKVRITQPNKNVLVETSSSDFIQANRLDRYIANEIEIIKDYRATEKVARTLIDSFDNAKNKNLFYLLKSEENKGINGHKSVNDLTALLKDVVTVEQFPETDIIEISAESPSPFEAALIANTYSIEYQNINLAINRKNFTDIRKFLEEQSQKKLDELSKAEDTLMIFQEEGGIVSLDIQSSGMIEQLSQIDAQKEATKIELSTSNEVLKQYKFFLRKQDPQLVDFLENETSQAYISALQEQLAELQVNRDLALSMKNDNIDISAKLKEYDLRIAELKQKLSTTIGSIKADAFSGNPDQVRDLAQRLIEEEIKNSTLSVKLDQLEAASRKYEGNLRRIPKTSTALSQYQRKRESLQQLFSTVDEKYQEAMINELSQSGTAFIISNGTIPNEPSKPNRLFIILIGLILAPSASFVYLLVKDYFDDTVKSPKDMEGNEINFLAWVPHSHNNNQHDNHELSVLYEPDSPISESFRAIEARIENSRADSEFPKLILVTSPAEGEGKTFVSVNLAGSFAQSNKRTLIIDCDLRRPKIHTIMGVDKKPGLVDHFVNDIKLEEIIRRTKINNLHYITSGSIPSNSAKVLKSDLMKNFLMRIQNSYDVIIIDSAPIVAAIDAEILSKLVDGTILVISADKTENRLMMDAIEIIKRNKGPFLGTVLNNFIYKNGYGYYYKYYYNYSSSKGNGTKLNKIKK
jgi:tyrosine-protein kinase Etk/Wzc